MSVEVIIQQLRSSHLLLAGYGREGRSTHAFIQQYVPDARVDIAENNEAIQARLLTESYDWVVKSPGIPMSVFDGRCPRERITSQTDLFLQAFAPQTIGVTATKGKSTSAALLTHVLHASDRKVVMAGNMGIPLLDILPQIAADTWVVAELSCHQLESIHRAPHIALILNLFEEHLDHYRDYRDYQNAKLNILLCQQQGDVGVYCADNNLLNARVEELRSRISSRLVSYHIPDNPSWAAQFPLLGDHNVGNAEAVRLALSAVGVSEQQFAASLPTFKGLEHRLERVGVYEDILFYNDSISTIPEAAIAAVEALKKVDTLILGGFDRGIDYSVLVDYLLTPDSLGASIRNLLFVGQAGRRIHGLLAAQCPGHGFQTLLADDYQQLVDHCFACTQPHRICLLSPAAASYDMFKNFEERGRCFKQLITHHKPAL